VTQRAVMTKLMTLNGKDPVKEMPIVTPNYSSSTLAKVSKANITQNPYQQQIEQIASNSQQKRIKNSLSSGRSGLQNRLKYETIPERAVSNPRNVQQFMGLRQQRVMRTHNNTAVDNAVTLTAHLREIAPIKHNKVQIED
jgi:hypothetical protein